MKVELSAYEKAVNILNGLTPRQDRIITEALDDLISQRDTARAEVARLTAEVEAMRAVVDEAERVYTTCEPNAPMLMQHLGESLDALRARKVGG